MTAFFIPDAEDPQEAETFYRFLRTALSAAGNTLTDRRIYSIGFSRDSKPHSATVGGLDTPSGEQVVAIFESHPDTLFLICTPRRGVPLGTMPYLAGPPSSVEVFDASGE